MLARICQAFLHRGRSQSPSAFLGLALLGALLAGGGSAGAESPGAGMLGEGEGVPAPWMVAVNEYIADPTAGAPKLIAVARQSEGIDLPPMAQLVVADAYLRTGNRRAAERMFESVLATNPGYPYEDFGNIGMGAVRLMSGDAQGAETYFGRVASAGEASSRVLGDLGMGSALATSGRFDEARAAFDKAGAAETVDKQFRDAGKFGSASARYGAGDYAGALRAFEELAATDPDGPIGRDARYAAARVRLAMGEFEEGAESLKKITADCSDDRRTRRPSRALRDLDARAIGRTWVKNYRRTAWTGLFTEESSMYSIDGCALARATLPAAERGDRRLMGVQRIATGAAAEPAAAPQEQPQQRRAGSEPAPPPATTSGSGWMPIAVAILVAAGAAALWRWRRSA